MKNLGGLKREILRYAQNDKNGLLIAHWYPVNDGLVVLTTEGACHVSGARGGPGQNDPSRSNF